MKKTLYLVTLILLTHFQMHAQNKNDLVGTWYGKLRLYTFKQDGNAQCYTKSKIAGWQQQLIIDRKFNYVYTEYYRGDTIRTAGRVDLNNNTLRFLVSQTNQPKSFSVTESFYPLYAINSTELIYSNFPARKVIKEEAAEDNIFQKVEEAAVYSLGSDEFMKALYTSLTKAGVGKDSVKMNFYKVIVDSSGNMDVTSLRSVNADPEYFDAIKQGLKNLPNNFKPAMQNGKAVNAYMSFKVTY